MSSEAVRECPLVDLGGIARRRHREGRIRVEVEALDAHRLVMVRAATISSPLVIYVICHFFDS